MTKAIDSAKKYRASKKLQVKLANMTKSELSDWHKAREKFVAKQKRVLTNPSTQERLRQRANKKSTAVGVTNAIPESLERLERSRVRTKAEEDAKAAKKNKSSTAVQEHKKTEVDVSAAIQTQEVPSDVGKKELENYDHSEPQTAGVDAGV